MDANLQSNLAPVVALTGFMAVGKSTIGCELACLLRWRSVDLDCEIHRSAGMRVQEIFAQHGEEQFRRLESDTLRSVLGAAGTPTVIALGGGTFVQQQNAVLLRERGARIVFLELDVQKLFQRCRDAADESQQNPRPLARDEAAFATLYEQRLPFYRQAELTVSTHGKNAQQVAREIAATLGLSPIR
jgi:shikimate kinase